MEDERAQCGVGAHADDLEEDDDVVACLDLRVDAALEPDGRSGYEDRVGPHVPERSGREATKPVLTGDLASDLALTLGQDGDADRGGLSEARPRSGLGLDRARDERWVQGDPDGER